MSPKHADKLPAPSSSDEEEDTTSEAEEEEEETSDEEQEQSQSQIPLTQKTSQIKKPEISSSPLTTATEGNESSESDGSESETDSDSAVPVIKPLATKPMVDDAKKLQSAAKPSASGAKSKAKRPAESNPKPDQKESKRSKKEPENGREEKLKESSKVKNDSEDGEDKGKKILFQRIWSQEDEIALLKGMIEFSKRGTDPATDVNAFYEFVKNSLHMDFGVAKLKDKMWRLKKKYTNHVKRGKGDIFSKAHEQEAYNLSKKIWMADDEVVKSDSTAQSNGKAKKNPNVSVVKAISEAKAIPETSNKQIIITKLDIPLDKRIGVGSIEEEVLSHGLNFVVGEKKASLEKRWKKLRIAEMELFLQRNELVSEQAKLMLDFYKSGKN